MSEKTNDKNELNEAACFYHSYPQPGKLEIAATKPLGNQRDLALAYSPGVAAPCMDIAEDPGKAFDYTARGNLVAVVSNGTAVLGLGPIGPLASKPVMEGKAVLFKKFAGVDVFDIEVDETEIDRFVDVVAALEPTFGGINLEDIKAPECFEIERKLREKMGIPVFHDDQHGTAIIVGAAALNGLEHAGKSLSEAKIVASGAGAAALACLNLLVSLGAKVENIWVTDIDGLVYEGREQMDRWKGVFAKQSDLRTLDDVIEGADIFLGLSAGGVLKPDMVARMAPNPLIMALANPNPEILPEEAKEVRPDAMLCTGRSDYPNQVNNVLCFPYIFRGALDVEATTINEEMKHAAVKAIAELAREEISDVAARAAEGKLHPFGPNYLIPTPFDPRLILRIAPAVAKAAMETGVAKRPIEDFEVYQDRLRRFVFRSGLIMKNMVAKAKSDPKRVVYADGEDERVLRAAQIALEDGLAVPILIGRPDVMRVRAERFGLQFKPGDDCEIINPQNDPRYRDYVDEYFECVGRRGVHPQAAGSVVRSNTTVIGAIAVKRGDGDALIAGLDGRFRKHLIDLNNVLGAADGMQDYSAMSLLINRRGAFFLTDTYVKEYPTAEEIAETAIRAADHIRRFGITPKIALLSSSNFGTRDFDTSLKMRNAVNLIWERAPELEVDGEMHGDAALNPVLRDRVMPNSRLEGSANLFVFPTLDAANIALNLMKEMTSGLHVGPILMGPSKPAHILTPSVTSRGVVNMTALASVDVQSYMEQQRKA